MGLDLKMGLKMEARISLWNFQPLSCTTHTKTWTWTVTKWCLLYKKQNPQQCSLLANTKKKRKHNFEATERTRHYILQHLYTLKHLNSPFTIRLILTVVHKYTIKSKLRFLLAFHYTFFCQEVINSWFPSLMKQRTMNRDLIVFEGIKSGFKTSVILAASWCNMVHLPEKCLLYQTAMCTIIIIYKHTF